jgi:LuxR family transcriptional regulator, maltose regulon positive regulatory protein
VSQDSAHAGAVAVLDGKLEPHRLPIGFVSRPGLTDLLRSGRDAGLTLVCAPAGYGKTTLLTVWMETSSLTEPETRFSWVSLDPGDSDPVRFWTTVVAACERAAPGAGTRALEVIRTLSKRQVDAALPLLLEDLARLDSRLVLILDDYHQAETPEIDETMARFLAYRPSTVQVVISTRSDPELHIPRLRARGQLVEVRSGDLAFSEEEAHEFLVGSGVTHLTGDQERRLVGRTAGWPAPLRLATIMMPSEHQDAFIASFSGSQRRLVDYLTTDVLDALDEAQRDFLLRVSILDRMCGSLCDAVTEGKDSAGLLAALERASLFVSADEAEEWYRTHQLFREALRAELSRTRADLVPVLHGRAARWFERAGDLRSATDHAIAARDVPLIGRLLAGQAQPMAAAGGQRDIFRRWIDRLDWREAQQDPEIGFARAMDATLHGELDQAGQWLDVAATGPTDQRDFNGVPLGFRVDYVRAISGVHDVGQAEAAGRRAVRSAPTPAYEGVAWTGVGQALYLQDRFDDARECLTRAISLLSDAHPLMLTMARANLVIVEAAQSSRVPPQWMLQDAVDVLRRAGAENTSASGVLEMAFGEVHRLTGRLGEAVVSLESALELLGAEGRSCIHANAHLLLARVQRDAGDPEAAARSLDVADSILVRARNPGALPARSQALRAHLRSPARMPAAYGQVLTERETEVLRLLGEGWSKREIAGRLFVSPNTVKTHVQSCYRKLGVTSRDGALAALERARAERHDRL